MLIGQYVFPVSGYQGALLSESQGYWMDLSDVKVMRRLVASLKYVFGLGHGVELPFILGCPQCANNDEALIRWITDELKHTDWVEAGHIFNFLIAQLKVRLEAYHEGWM